MRLLVTAAAGMLGQDIVTAAGAQGHDVVGLSRADLDVTDGDAVSETLRRLQPDAIVNCAAWTDVDAAELHEAEALAVNGPGAGNVARAAAAVGAHLVHVSTDYVFDGQASRPYVESDATGPITAYGRTKLAGERDVLGAEAGHAVARTSWLFGVGGRNFVRTMLGASAEREEVAVVTDQVGCPTFTGHLATALIELAERRQAGLHHVAGSGHCSWNEFAVEIFAQAGVNCRVRPSTTAEQGRLAVRPPWSVLGTERADAVLLPAWTDGLSEYLVLTGEAVAR